MPSDSFSPRIYHMISLRERQPKAIFQRIDGLLLLQKIDCFLHSFWPLIGHEVGQVVGVGEENVTVEVAEPGDEPGEE